MNRKKYLEQRLNTLETLGDAVSAMRSISAHHFRLSRQSLPAARAYRDEIEKAIADVGASQRTNSACPPGLLLIVSDLGLCGDYNTRLVEAAVEVRRQQGDGPLYCVGHRPRVILAGHGLLARRLYPAPASVDGLAVLLLQLAQDVLHDFQQRDIGSLSVVSARFEAAGHFVPVSTVVLPIRPRRAADPLRPTHYQSYGHLAAVAAREFLYTTLHELLLDSLASEHGMRLLAAESARQWLDETCTAVGRQLSNCRRSDATQEVLDIVAGVRHRGVAK